MDGRKLEYDFGTIGVVSFPAAEVERVDRNSTAPLGERYLSKRIR